MVGGCQGRAGGGVKSGRVGGRSPPPRPAAPPTGTSSLTGRTLTDVSTQGRGISLAPRGISEGLLGRVPYSVVAVEAGSWGPRGGAAFPASGSECPEPGPRGGGSIFCDSDGLCWETKCRGNNYKWPGNPRTLTEPGEAWTRWRGGGAPLGVCPGSAEARPVSLRLSGVGEDTPAGVVGEGGRGLNQPGRGRGRLCCPGFLNGI